ncbi:hypothetical protein V6Z11_A11G250600 [Gossypium hirsutum]
MHVGLDGVEMGLIVHHKPLGNNQRFLKLFPSY